MKLAQELNKRTAPFLKMLMIRKLIFAGVSLLIIILAVLGCFYYQLALEKGLVTLISGGVILLLIVLTAILLFLSRSDDYKRTMITAFAGKANTDKFENTKDAMMRLEKHYKTLGGYSNFKSAYNLNKRLLKAMCKNCTAFEHLADKGFKTKVSSIFAPFAFASYNYFAIIDAINTTDGDNTKQYIISSTRWYKIYNRYSKDPIPWVISQIIPFVIWFIAQLILNLVLDSSIDICADIQNIITIGSLCVLLQMRNLTGAEKIINNIVIDFADAKSNIIPEANFNIAYAFAKLDGYYYKQCVELGYLQPEGGTDGT